MSERRTLELEVLSGPLDGNIISLQEDAEWTAAGTGPLAFPWDDELGEPQARLTPCEKDWILESHKSPHGTYCINREQRIEDRIELAVGDIIKASHSWLVVHRIY